MIVPVNRLVIMLACLAPLACGSPNSGPSARAERRTAEDLAQNLRAAVGGADGCEAAADVAASIGTPPENTEHHLFSGVAFVVS
jgi:hypothetical protein